MHKTAFCILLSLFCFAWPPALLSGQQEVSEDDRPLPELDSFLARVKDGLKSDRLLLCQYTYTMKTTTRNLDGKGRVTKAETREYEVYPSLEEDETYERLVAENGRPVDPKKIEAQDREFRKKTEAPTRRLAAENSSDREKRLAKEAEESRKERATIEDLLQLYAFALTSRESVEGHSGVWIEFVPRPEYRPKTRDGEMLKKIRGRALVSESDYQVMRVDAELIDDLSFGLGLLARVHRGTRLTFIRRKVNDEVWLPAESHFAASVRRWLFKRLRIESTSVFSGYMKYSVSSTQEIVPGVPLR